MLNLSWSLGAPERYKMWGANLQATSRNEYHSDAVIIIKDSQATFWLVAFIKTSNIKKRKGKKMMIHGQLLQNTYSIVAKMLCFPP